jgi:signal transduction histidine kinase
MAGGKTGIFFITPADLSCLSVFSGTIHQPRRGHMKPINRIHMALLSGVLASIAVFAADFGTAAEAKTMLERAVAELKKDKAGALAKFNKGEGGFRDRDLYPFCAGPNGIATTHPTQFGKNLKELKDKTGKPFGEEMYRVAEEDKIKEVTYLWPRPGSTEPVQKISYVTKVGDQVCGVGYYKQ